MGFVFKRTPITLCKIVPVYHYWKYPFVIFGCIALYFPDKKKSKPRTFIFTHHDSTQMIARSGLYSLSEDCFVSIRTLPAVLPVMEFCVLCNTITVV